MNISKDYILVNSNTVADRNKCGFIQQQLSSYFQFSDENRTQNILIKQLTVLNRFVLIVVFDIIIVALSEFNNIAK